MMVSRASTTRKSVLDYDYSIKCIVLGDSGVGKTSLLQKMVCAKHAMKTTPTVEGIFHAKSVMVNGRRIQLSIWDTAGQEAFRSVTRIYYRGASCAILVYDITRRSTFTSLPAWLEDLKLNSNNNKPVLVLVANKCDLAGQRVVSREEGQNFAKQNHMKYLEASAEKSTNIDQIFQVMSEEVYQNIKIGSIIPNNEINGIKVGRMPSVSDKKEPHKKKTCSC